MLAIRVRPFACHVPRVGLQDWTDYIELMNFSKQDLQEAATKLEQRNVRWHPEEINASLEGLAVDHLGAVAVCLLQSCTLLQHME